MSSVESDCKSLPIVKMIDQGSSELNVIVGVNEEDFEQAIRCIYDMFVNAVEAK
ncbi:MAG: hypothetical protein IJ512_02775 [Ruminococcus sp.]|nr:hypothetical protein [Ruminococcus sp.]